MKDSGVFVWLKLLGILNLSRNSIEKLPEYVFSGNPSLTTVDLNAEVHSLLNIDDNSISTLRDVSFGNILTILDISYNNLISLNADSLENNSSLSSIFLHHNKIQSIAINSFNQLENVRTLDLSFNELKNLLLGLFSLLNYLENLNVSDNIVDCDFDSLTTSPHLITLNLKNNKVLNFDGKIILKLMKNLTEIKLGYYISNCSALSGLVRKLYRNQINIIPGNTTNSINVFESPCEEHSDFEENNRYIQVPFAIPSQNVTTDKEIVGEHAVPSSLVSLVKENNDHSTKSIENNLIEIVKQTVDIHNNVGGKLSLKNTAINALLCDKEGQSR
ncbi:hypothetical protein ABEB36_008078 [Hypothenemus hampei]|uniref:Uncharacterized protein n=1 Tax=Hypothenemus hampei TaxID=57062 RepID=A0ABD1EKM2_HYPHA